MAIDFGKMAADAKADSDARVEKAAKSKLDEAAALERVLAEGTGYLEQAVLPVLKAAQAAFAASGVPSVVSDNFSADTKPTTPKLYFICGGQQIANGRGGHVNPKGVLVTISYMHGRAVVSAQESVHGNGSSLMSGDLEKALEIALKRSLSTYMEAKERALRSH